MKSLSVYLHQKKVSALAFITMLSLLGYTPVISAGAAPANAPEAAPNNAPLLAPIAAVSLSVPANVMVGESFTFTATFSNTSGTASDIGYGPFIDIILPANGADGNGNQSLPLDGIDFISATYLGTAVTSTVLTFPGSGAANTCVNHPYAVAPTTGAPLQVCGVPGDKLLVLQLPFGSFVPGQPAVTVSINASLSNLADVGTALNIRARGGYQYGATPTNDWCCSPFDATILSHPSTNSSTWPASPLTPQLFTITKSYSGPENETATGPNFPHQYTLTVNIANGQTLTNLDATDTLPNTMQFVSFDSSTPGSSAVSTPSTITPGGTLTRRFASVTGTAGTADATVIFTFYIPRLNTLGAAVLNATTGAPATSVNNAQATANWTPVDLRDTTTPVTGVCTVPCHTLTDRSIATQKSVVIVNDTAPAGVSPGDTLEYTLEFQISDFFAFNNVVLTDIISDGQHLDLAFTPTLTVNGNGFALAAAGMNAANYSEIRHWTGGPAVAPINGTTELVFRASAEIVTRGQPNGRLIGGCINPINGSNPPDCGTYNNNSTMGTIVFRAQIQQNFTDVFPSGDPSVDHGDILDDNLTITGDVLNPTTPAFTATGSTATDNSIAGVIIAFGGLTKSAYAINGTVCEPCTTQITTNGINPGDTVTYRLSYTLPASDFEPTVVTDYLPLPVFSAPELTIFSNVMCGVPGAGNACLGPNDTFHTLTTPIPSAPTLSTNGTANTVIFSYAAYDNTSDITSAIDLLFTVTVSGQQFADGLFLTNQANVTEGTTNATPTAQNAIIQIKLNEPALYTTKAAVSTDNPNGTFTPAITAPIAFNTPGTAGLSWGGGTISSTYLNATPIDSDLSKVDAGDLIRFAIVIRNEGHSQKGAFDISIRDTFQPGYVIPGGLGLNLQIYRGDGLALTYTDLGGGIFGTGIKVDDPGAPGVGACQAHDATNGRNVIVITYDLQLDTAITLDQGIINTATLFNYGATSGGPDFSIPDITDTATVQPVTAPTKSIVTTSEAHTSEAGTGTIVDPRLATVGEVAHFRIQQGLPEGIVTNFRLHDVLPAGLTFIDDNTARVTFVSDGGGGVSSDTLSGAGLNATGDETSVAGITPTFALPDTTVSMNDSTATANYAADDVDTYASGDDIFFKFGTVNNTDRDNNNEYVVIEFNAIVANIAGNNAGANLDNTATARFGSSTTESASSAVVRVLVVEPAITFGKTIVSLPSPLDAGGIVQYRLSYANGIGANVSTAFDIRLTDPLPVQLSLNLASITVTLAGGAAGVTDTSAANNVDFTIASVPAGGSVTIDYTATIQDIITPAQIITNTSTSTWTSLPGTGTSPNGTGSIAGAVGGTTGERTGTGVAPNTYISTSSQSFTTDTPTSFIKQLTATSASHTSGTDVAIGEVATYSILLTLPEGTTPADTVVDDLPTGLAIVSGTPQIITTAAASGGLLSANFNATIGTQSITAILGDGGSVQFDFTNIVLTGDNDTTNNTILMQFQAQVTDILANQAGGIISNSATNQVGVGAPITSNVVTVTVVEPSITFGKTIVSLPTPVDAGGVVQYRISYVNNTGATISTALDVHISDVLPAQLSLNLPITVTLGGGAAGIADASAGNNLDVTITSIPAGGSVIVDYTATILNTVTPGDIINNTSNSNWTSLNGPITGERTGTGGVDDYFAASNQNFTIASSNVITKQLATTSASHTPGSSVTIGEEITYEILLTFPEGTTASDTVVDDIPAGLAIVGGTPEVITSALLSGGSLTADFNGTLGTQNISVVAGDGGSVQFDFTNIILAGDNDTSNNTILMRFRARVTNLGANVGFPVATTISNGATNQVNTGTPTPSNTVDVTVVEPRPVLTKSLANITTPASGTSGILNDVIRMTLTYQNTGTSNAYDVVIIDALDSTKVNNLTPVTTPAGFTYSTSGTNPVTVQYAANAGVAVASGATIVFELDFTLTAGNTIGSVISNTANVTQTSTLDNSTPDGDDANERNSTTNASANLNFNGVALIIAKDDGGITAVPGDVVVYTLNFSNAGNLDAHNVVITDTVPVNTTFNVAGSSAGWSCANAAPAGTVCTYAYGTLAIGANNSLLFAVNVPNPAPAGLNQVDNTASINSDQPEVTTTNNASQDLTSVTAVPNLLVTKDDGLDIVSPGYTITYTITVTNNGNQGATGLQLVDAVPAGMSFVSATGGGAFAIGQITWPAFSLTSNTSTSFTVQLKVADPAGLGNITAFANSVHVQDDGSNTNGTPVESQDTDIDQLASTNVKTLTNTNQPGSANPDALIGEILSYSIRIDIPSGTINNLKAVDVLDHGLAFVGCDPTTPISSGSLVLAQNPCTTSSALTIQNDPVTDTNPASVDAGRHITFDFGQVQNNSGSTQTLTVSYQAIVLDIAENANGVSGVNNGVTWTWEGGSLSGSAIDINVVEPDLAILKTVDPQATAIGSIVTYTIQIEHTSISAAPAYDVLVTDSIPTGLILIPASVILNSTPGLPAATVTIATTTIAVFWPSFPLGESATITFQAQFVGPSPVVNSANVQWTSIQIDPQPIMQPQSGYNIYSTERRYDPLSQVINDYLKTSNVTLTTPVLPKTGFAPGVQTLLPIQPRDIQYTSLGELWMEIPALNLKMPIVGIPSTTNGWDLTWLANQSGWLEGTAYPTHAGNSAITAHAYLASGDPGPFARLGELRYGDQIIIHLDGQRYVYEVRQNKLVRPNDLSILKHEEYPWLTLITCKSYNESTHNYLYRTAVRAVLVKVDTDR